MSTLDLKKLEMKADGTFLNLVRRDSHLPYDTSSTSFESLGQRFIASEFRDGTGEKEDTSLSLRVIWWYAENKKRNSSRIDSTQFNLRRHTPLKESTCASARGIYLALRLLFITTQPPCLLILAVTERLCSINQSL